MANELLSGAAGSFGIGTGNVSEYPVIGNNYCVILGTFVTSFAKVSGIVLKSSQLLAVNEGGTNKPYILRDIKKNYNTITFEKGFGTVEIMSLVDKMTVLTILIKDKKGNISGLYYTDRAVVESVELSDLNGGASELLIQKMKVAYNTLKKSDEISNALALMSTLGISSSLIGDAISYNTTTKKAEQEDRKKDAEKKLEKANKDKAEEKKKEAAAEADREHIEEYKELDEKQKKEREAFAQDQAAEREAFEKELAEQSESLTDEEMREKTEAFAKKQAEDQEAFDKKQTLEKDALRNKAAEQKKADFEKKQEKDIEAFQAKQTKEKFDFEKELEETKKKKGLSAEEEAALRNEFAQKQVAEEKKFDSLQAAEDKAFQKELEEVAKKEKALEAAYEEEKKLAEQIERDTAAKKEKAKAAKTPQLSNPAMNAAYNQNKTVQNAELDQKSADQAKQEMLSKIEF